MSDEAVLASIKLKLKDERAISDELSAQVAGLKADNDAAWRDIQALRTMDERNVAKIVALKADNERQKADIETLLEANAEMAAGSESFAAEIESLRAVLSQLIDALDGLETYTADGVPAAVVVKRLADARAAAVSVLKGRDDVR